jgi:hypothetical protein
MFNNPIGRVKLNLVVYEYSGTALPEQSEEVAIIL